MQASVSTHCSRQKGFNGMLAEDNPGGKAKNNKAG